MKIYIVSTLENGSVEVKAESFTMTDNGLLTFYAGASMVALFRSWQSVTTMEPA